MATPITTLKTYFETGKKPTQTEFEELIDAFIHQDEDLSAYVGIFAEIAEAQAGLVQNKYMNPYLTKLAIYALTRLADIPELETEVDDKVNTREPVFSKNTAFNKDFGYGASEVMPGDHFILSAYVQYNGSTNSVTVTPVRGDTASFSAVVNLTGDEITVTHNYSGIDYVVVIGASPATGSNRCQQQIVKISSNSFIIDRADDLGNDIINYPIKLLKL